MEPISATLFTFGIILLAVSWIQLMFISFREDFTWGLFTLFLPFLSYLYGLFVWDKTKSAIWLAVGGCALLIFSF